MLRIQSLHLIRSSRIEQYRLLYRYFCRHKPTNRVVHTIADRPAAQWRKTVKRVWRFPNLPLSMTRYLPFDISSLLILATTTVVVTRASYKQHTHSHTVDLLPFCHVALVNRPNPSSDIARAHFDRGLLYLTSPSRDWRRTLRKNQRKNSATARALNEN